MYLAKADSTKNRERTFSGIEASQDLGEPGIVESSEFIDFARTCENIRSTRSKLQKVEFLSRYLLTLLCDADLNIVCTFLSGRIFQLGSASINEVNVGYSLLWSTFANLLGIDDCVLSKYYLKHGDLGSAIEDFLSSHDSTKIDRFSEVGVATKLFGSPSLKIQDVFNSFKELARSTGKRSTEKKRQILTRLFSSSIKETGQAKYLIRILSGEMRIGLVEGLVEESLARAFQKTLQEIRTANLVMGSIGLVAVMAKHDRLEEAKLEPMRPTNFMLAETAETAQELYDKFGGDSRVVISEYKYDGVRAQVHLAAGRVAIFSRNLEDVTRYFPEIESEIRKSTASVHDLILDGEIIASNDGSPLPFQLLQRRLRKLELSDSDVPVRYFVSDLLYFDRPLIDQKLSVRIKILRSLELGGRIAFSSQRPVSSSEEIASIFQESKSLGFEGLVVKDPDSAYTPGRRGASWIKLKKELDTLDVVIVAAEYGHGKRAGVISDYTFAVRDEAENLKVVGKAYSGLTDAEIREMTETLKEITLKDHGYRMSVKPQIVLEVAFDAIQRSDRHDSGYALRFPRIRRIRKDKSIFDIDTMEKVKRIYESQKVRA